MQLSQFLKCARCPLRRTIRFSVRGGYRILESGGGGGGGVRVTVKY